MTGTSDSKRKLLILNLQGGTNQKGFINVSHRGYVGVPAPLTVQSLWRRAAQQLLSEVFAEVFAHQIEGKGVHAGVGEGQNASAHTGDKVSDGGVHLVVVERAVQVDHMTGQPAECKQANKH